MRRARALRAHLSPARARSQACAEHHWPIHDAGGGGVRRPLPSDGAENTDHQRPAPLRTGVERHLVHAARTPQGTHRAPHDREDFHRGTQEGAPARTASALLRWRGRVRPPKSHATRARQYMPEEHIPPHVKNGG